MKKFFRNKTFTKIRVSINSFIGYIYLLVVGLTTKFIFIKNEKAKRLKQKIYAFWHGRQVILAYAYRFKNVCTLSSSSEASLVIVNIIKRFGYTSVLGSSSRQPVRALLQLKKKIKEGYNIAITPDGPRGPYRKVKEGVIYLAQKTGIPIVPVTASEKRKVVIFNWDRFHVPLPFNKCVIIEDEPFYVGKDVDIKEKCRELEKILNKITIKADKLIRC